VRKLRFALYTGYSGSAILLPGGIRLSDDTCNTAPMAINEVQMVLAEKRTSLSVMRTGIAVLALPLSVMSVLIATSKYYDVLHVLHFLIPLAVINLVLIVLGAHLILRSTIRMRHYDHLISEIKRQHSVIAEFID
jgi:uncharacterized membrane protein YidH (DUF202 family)